MSAVPREFDDIHKPEFSPRLTIISPVSSGRYDAKTPLTINLSSSGRFPLSRVDFFVNDRYIGQILKSPFIYKFIPSTIEEVRGQNVLRVVGYDSVLNKTEVSVNF